VQCLTPVKLVQHCGRNAPLPVGLVVLHHLVVVQTDIVNVGDDEVLTYGPSWMSRGRSETQQPVITPKP